jgi:hypothetical protein
MCNLGFESNSIRFQFKFPSNSSPKLKYIFHFNMVDLCSKCPIQNLWQIYKSISMQNFTFFGGPQLFLLFLFSHADLFNSKKDLNWKNHRESFSPRRPSSALRQPNPAGEAGPRHLLPRDATKRAPVPRGPHTSASLLRGRKLLRTRPAMAPGTLPNPSPSSATRRTARQ